MKNWRGVCAAAAAFCLCLALVPAARAGFEPTPWQPQINQLNAVQNNLRSINERVVRVLGMPPDPYAPSPNVNGAVGRLGAMENQLVLLDQMLISVMDEVLANPPDPWVPAELVPALEGVRAASQGIADTIDAYLSTPPDPWVPAAFLGAVSSTGLAAQNLADDAVHYLSGGCSSGFPCGCIGTATPCAGFLDPLSCTGQVGCHWSTEVGGGCLGTPAPCSEFTTVTSCGAQAGCGVGTCVEGTCQLPVR